jgi:hypothetical protein
MSKGVDCPNLPFSDNQRSIADGKISLNVNRRVVNPACIAGVLTFLDTVVPISDLTKRSIAVGDFNGDGAEDLVASNAPATSLSVLLGNRDGTFRAPLVFLAGTNLQDAQMPSNPGNMIASWRSRREKTQDPPS